MNSFNNDFKNENDRKARTVFIYFILFLYMITVHFFYQNTSGEKNKIPIDRHNLLSFSNVKLNEKPNVVFLFNEKNNPYLDEKMLLFEQLENKDKVNLIKIEMTNNKKLKEEFPYHDFFIAFYNKDGSLIKIGKEKIDFISRTITLDEFNSLINSLIIKSPFLSFNYNKFKDLNIIFSKEIENMENFNQKKSTIVLFYTTWCDDCKFFKETFYDRFEKENKDKYNFINIDVDKEQNSIFDKFEFVNIPSVVIYDKNGKISFIQTFSEGINKDDFIKEIKDFLNEK